VKKVEAEGGDEAGVGEASVVAKETGAVEMPCHKMKGNLL
jgi:hypothetical protein